jgi:hypothetical protein
MNEAPNGEAIMMTDLTRRTLGLAAAAAGLVPVRVLAQPASDLKEAARQMWLFTLPLIEMARTRGPNKPNSLLHARALSGPAAHNVTTPNCDTLYSIDWLDLRGGPVTVTLPATGDRYMSAAFMDMYTNNFIVLGTNSNGGRGGTYVIEGPSTPGKPGANTHRSNTPWVWMLARTLVTSDADLPAAHAVQDKIKVTGGKAGAPGVASIDRAAPWADYFKTTQALLAESPPPVSDAAFLVRHAALGLSADKPFDATRFTPAQVAQIEAGVLQARADVRVTGSGNAISGSFGSDYTARARVALGGLAALPSSEAVYMKITPPAGSAGFTGGTAYRLSFTKAQLPPARAFWSLSMYEITAAGQMYFTENPIKRYAINDRTPGLAFRPDGGLDLWIGSAYPGSEKRANWLPSPATGPFAMVLRGYLPKPEMLNGTYKPPAATLA